MFKKATKEQSRLRMALHGPSGSGKTYSALSIATHLGRRIALVDTESGSASKYADAFSFDVAELTGDYNPDRFIAAVTAAAEAGYDVVVIDSLTHAWNGKGGFLDLVDAQCKRSNSSNSFAAWKALTPVYQRLVQTLLNAPIHVIVTLRAKQEYVQERGDNGKTKITKVGMAPEIRDNFQYEMDVEGMMDLDHNLVIGKTRCSAIDGKVYQKPGKDLADALNAWLTSGVQPTVHDTEEAAKIAAVGTVEELNTLAKTFASFDDVKKHRLKALYAKRLTELKGA